MSPLRRRDNQDQPIYESAPGVGRSTAPLADLNTHRWPSEQARFDDLREYTGGIKRALDDAGYSDHWADRWLTETGDVPPGTFTYDRATEIISGHPTEVGTYFFDVEKGTATINGRVEPLVIIDTGESDG